MDFVEFVIDRPTSVDRDEVEDDLNEHLAGMAEVTGAGIWQSGVSLDLEVNSSADRCSVLDAVFDVLERLVLGDLVRVRPGDGSERVAHDRQVASATCRCVPFGRRSNGESRALKEDQL